MNPAAKIPSAKVEVIVRNMIESVSGQVPKKIGTREMNAPKSTYISVRTVENKIEYAAEPATSGPIRARVVNIASRVPVICAWRITAENERKDESRYVENAAPMSTKPK